MARKNGAKMTSRSRKKFPVRVSETKRVKITLPYFKSLTAVDLCPKDDFDQLFDFQGRVISECTIVRVPTFVHATTRCLRLDYKKTFPLVPFL